MGQSQTTPMTSERHIPNSAFMDLPVEIRTLIYQQLFLGGRLEPVKWADVNRRTFTDDRDKIRLQMIQHSIVLVSRRIREEALPLLYRYSTFHLNGVSIFSPILRVWQVKDLYGLFPNYSTSSEERSTIELIQHVHYEDRNIDFVRRPKAVFSNLKLLELDVGSEYMPSDQTVMARAIKYIRRDRDLRHTIKDYLERDYRSGEITHALFDLQKLGLQERGFEVSLLWRLSYRFLTFKGTCDLDEWILKIWDAENETNEIYDIPQDPLFCEVS